MTATAYDRVVTALRDTVPSVRANGTSAVANCPAHHDQHPSLGITWIEGSVLLNCRSQQCPIDDILAALHLTKADLYDEPAGATYRYDDGRIVHRTPDKRFRQSGATKGTGQLYRLAKVEQAVADGRPVYLVEGEKDVHALETLGVTATTTPMGAGNFDKADPSPLKGAHVVIVPDRDDGGRNYAAAAAAILHGLAATVETKLIAAGKDAADHIAAGFTLDDLIPVDTPGAATGEPRARHVRLTPASAIRPRRVRWTWQGRLAAGTLSLLAGREGLGKSTIAYWLAARVTTGQLEGEDLGTPRAVFVCANEDSWEHTIVPRLIAAGANLDLVYRVEMVTHDHLQIPVSLPRDFYELEEAAEQKQPGLMIVDPLMSVIDAKLDTHRDREVRSALEPLAGVADRTRMVILGLIHHNKSGSTDALNLVMASKAFTAVSRSVHTCIPDPDDEDQARRLFMTTKNNLGRLDLPVLGFIITSHAVDTDDDGTAWTGRLKWTGEVAGAPHEIMTRSADPERSATAEAADWLRDYLEQQGATAPKKDVLKAGQAAGHATRTLTRAREQLKITYESAGFPRQTFWTLPDPVTPPSPQLPKSDDWWPEDDGPTASQANPPGPTAKPGHPGTTNSQAAITDTHSQAKSGQPLAPLGPTGPDQAKHENPHAGARAGGDTPLAQLDLLAPLDNTVGPTPRGAHARARDPSTDHCPHCDRNQLPPGADMCDECAERLHLESAPDD
jgi:hypothetical protein